MRQSRLTQAVAGGDLALPDDLVVMGPAADDPLPDVPGLRVVTHDRVVANGLSVPHMRECPMADTILVCIPRSKPLARAMVAEAARCASTRVIVDGQKTDGIDGLYRELRKRFGDLPSVTKAHGRMTWFAPDAEAVADWVDPGPQKGPHGLYTRVGVFSADGIDPATQSLIQALPPLSGAVADLGAGWGALSRGVQQNGAPSALHLVETDARALDLARMNVAAPAQFHWADATTWISPQLMDHVVMNPPFHTSRKADPDLGRGFIAAAARALKPRGTLWMVANRHLPYEDALASHFAQIDELPGSQAFKIFQASRPRR